jgi:hypothetical protein
MPFTTLSVSGYKPKVHVTDPQRKDEMSDDSRLFPDYSLIRRGG